MKAMWGPDPVSFEGETMAVRNAHFNPKPVQTPHPPIWVGGESTPALRRVASFANGWYGFGLDPDQVPDVLKRLDGHLADAGRSRQEITVAIGPGRTRLEPGDPEKYAANGVDQLVVGLGARDLDQLDQRIEGILQLTEGVRG